MQAVWTLNVRARRGVRWRRTDHRYGALYADVTFAKLELVAHGERDGVPYVRWNGFDDIRAWLEMDAPLPGPVAPVRCPGWTLPRS